MMKLSHPVFIDMPICQYIFLMSYIQFSLPLFRSYHVATRSLWARVVFVKAINFGRFEQLWNVLYVYFLRGARMFGFFGLSEFIWFHKLMLC